MTGFSFSGGIKLENDLMKQPHVVQRKVHFIKLLNQTLRCTDEGEEPDYI